MRKRLLHFQRNPAPEVYQILFLTVLLVDSKIKTDPQERIYEAAHIGKVGTSDSGSIVVQERGVHARDSAGISRTPACLYDDYQHRIPHGTQESRAPGS